MKRLFPMLIILAACGDASDPLPSGGIILSAEVQHVEPHPHTCEWQVTADARNLTDVATWTGGSVDYGASSTELVGYWLPATRIEPGEISSGGWRGYGPGHAWSATVTMRYSVAARADSASVSFRCD